MSKDFFYYLKSIVPNIDWPSLSDENGAQMLGIQYQLEQSQWMSPCDIEKHQFRQLERLLSHACETVPYYQDSLQGIEWQRGKTLTPDLWRSLPIVTRADVQRSAEYLLSNNAFEEHGPTFQLQTSGSTGMPVSAWGNSVTLFFTHALILRQHLWHGRDFGATLAAINPDVKASPGIDVSSSIWGPATDMVLTTGNSHMLNSRTDVDKQAEWLTNIDPVYLVTMPTNFSALATYFKTHSIRLNNLREVSTFGEVVTNKARQLSLEVFGAPLRDNYSAREVGPIGIECPKFSHYHVQSECIRVEVLDDDGCPVSPGEIGRVILTPLHNFTMPLIRYEIGDYAQLGESCDCGRGLPVLKQIMGRSRNMLVRPDGKQHWPSFPEELWTEVAPVMQFQLIQTNLHTIHVNIVTARALTTVEEDTLRGRLQERFGYPFDIVFYYHDQIRRTPGDKYEEFLSELPQQ